MDRHPAPARRAAAPAHRNDRARGPHPLSPLRTARLLTFVCLLSPAQVRRQAETRLREHFSEPIQAQARAALIARDGGDDGGDGDTRAPAPL